VVGRVSLFMALFCSIALEAGEGDGYVRRLDSSAEFERISVPERFLPGVDRTTKFTVPARDDPSLLPVLFQNANKYRFHQDFLAGEFPDRFPGLTGPDYLALVERRATRSYFAGVFFRFPGSPNPTYGFDVFTINSDPTEFPRVEEARRIHDLLASAFTLGPIAYAPRDPVAIANAQSWTNPGFPLNFSFGGATADYIAYTSAENFGRLRILTQQEFTDGNDSGAFSFQDLLVLPFTPTDIEGVIAGVITSTLQGELGHLAIRTARRGTPNAFVRDAATALAAFDGKLVHLVVEPEDFQISEATLADAEAFWSTHRPPTPPIVDVDPDYKKFDASWEIPIDDYDLMLKRYGGKATNGAFLYDLLAPQYRAPGFAIPYYYYIQFMQSNKTASRIDPSRQVTYQEYIQELIADPTFRSDSKHRYDELQRFRDLINDEGKVDPALLQTVALRVLQIFGTANAYVRFRSSSNVEHLREFNGAGLHESTSGCAADELDADALGPSKCDPTTNKEHGVLRAVKVVWGSLWNFRAYEEREYYQIDQLKSRMAIWVYEAFTGPTEEIINGVTFTGNPDVIGDRRYIVTSQLGDTPVVSPPEGVVSEKDILVMDQGAVQRIIRARPSSLAKPGELVLTDDRLKEMGGIMADVEKRYPVGPGPHDPSEVLLDMEFKVTKENQLIWKDVRQFLIANTSSSVAEFTLKVADGLTGCTSFKEGRAMLDVLKLKARVGFHSGPHLLRGDGTSPADFIDWIQFEEDGPQIPPVASGLWAATLTNEPEAGYRFSTFQEFQNKGQRVRVYVGNVFLPNSGPKEVTIGPEDLSWAINSHGPLRVEVQYPDDLPPPDGPDRTAWILPCDLEALSHYQVDAQFTSGDRARIQERFTDVCDGTGPAEVAQADFLLAGQPYTVADYWRLVYSAGHHNDTPFPRYWALLESPVDVPGVGPVKGVEVFQGFKGIDNDSKPSAALLGADYQVIKPQDLVLFRRCITLCNSCPTPCPIAPLCSEVAAQFRRGDADSSGKVTISDAIAILRYEFAGGKLACPDAADVDDQGSVEIDDAIILLAYLFLGLDAPADPGPLRCGEDVEPDDLPDCDGAGCR
jgi:hypothetical protein